MNFQILDSFAMPSQDTNVKRYKPKSTEVHIEYILKMYERIFKVSNVTSIGLPVLIRILEAGLPEGVLLDIKEYKAEDVKHRYIPDKQLLELKKEYEKSK
ncbi:PREDICTED: uncharacterized protein LOC105362896 [Ceratosolen solmsi marchali]|uniref:Uncharacterized protein LOC105362896 n=1 Tax=Ceratosolen solmsi marchali TaxID=326594 RepID=A0AAJ6YIN0_9HYME|nr:PREDICTED: uncharacterized protein LOC105362896 [Ceratosolen solmsi marchali]